MNKPAQFTPGPRIERTPGNWTVQHNNNDDTTYIVANDPRLGADMVAEIYRVSAYEGNATLIAAAPAMYQSGTLTVDIMERVAKELERKGLEELRSLLRSAIIEQKQAIAQAEGR